MSSAFASLRRFLNSRQGRAMVEDKGTWPVIFFTGAAVGVVVVQTYRYLTSHPDITMNPYKPQEDIFKASDKFNQHFLRRWKYDHPILGEHHKHHDETHEYEFKGKEFVPFMRYDRKPGFLKDTVEAESEKQGKKSKKQSEHH